MILFDKVLTVIPARGSSKRVPGKNIALVGGIPLIVHTFRQLKKTPLVKSTYVSSESQPILNLAREHGFNSILRPSVHSSDASSTEDVLLHALNETNTNNSFDWILTLPPTSPFRKPETLVKAVELVSQDHFPYDCVMAFNENRADFWHMSNNSLLRLFPNHPRRQQDRPPLYEENSAFYLTRISALIASRSVLGDQTCIYPLLIDKLEAFDINDEYDMTIASFIADANKVQ